MRLRPKEVFFNLLRHEPTALFEEFLVIFGTHFENIGRNTVSLEILLKLINISNITEVLLPHLTCLDGLREVVSRSSVTNSNVNSLLEVRIVCNLVVETLRSIKLFPKVCLGKDVVNVPDIAYDVCNLKSAREERVGRSTLSANRIQQGFEIKDKLNLVNAKLCLRKDVKIDAATYQTVISYLKDVIERKRSFISLKKNLLCLNHYHPHSGWFALRV